MLGEGFKELKAAFEKLIFFLVVLQLVVSIIEQEELLVGLNVIIHKFS